jgi:hypothetical protein
VGKSGHPDQFLYIDCWQDAVLSRPTWLRPCLEETYRIMVARVAATSKCREKTKEPILAEKPEEMPPPYVPLYPPLPPAPSSAPSPSISYGETRGTVILVKSGLETPGASTSLTSLSPLDPMPTLSHLVLTPHPPFNREHPTVSVRTPPLLRFSLPCKCP